MLHNLLHAADRLMNYLPPAARLVGPKSVQWNNLPCEQISILVVFAPSAFCGQRAVNRCNIKRMAESANAKPITKAPRGTCSRSGSSTLPWVPHFSIVCLVHPESSANIHEPAISPAIPKSASQLPCPSAATAVPGQ